MQHTAFVIAGSRELAEVAIPVPEAPLPGHVALQIGFCGICGSDVAAYRAGYPYPANLAGHEFSATVVAIGEGVTDLAVDDRVSRTSLPPCGACKMCVGGHPERCDVFAVGSLATAPPHGGYGRFIHMPAQALVKLPDNVSLEQGALVEPATVALHGVRRRQPELGDTVIVLGVGVIGLFAVQFARLAGATRVVAVDLDPTRLELARELGADAAFTPDDEALDPYVRAATNGRGADIAYDCAGAVAAQKLAVSLLRTAGKLMLIGVPFAPIEVSMGPWFSKEIDVQTSLAHHRFEFDITVDLLSRGLLRTTGMTTDIVGLSELPAVFEQLAERSERLKVLVDPRS